MEETLRYAESAKYPLESFTSSMFEGPGNPELVEELREKLASFGSQVAFVDRVRLATARRRHGGLGRPLTARGLPRSENHRPYALSDRPRRETAEGRSRLKQEMAKIRRTLKSLGFKPFGRDILVKDPAMAYHDADRGGCGRPSERPK
jgi:hypothetical protein